MFSFSSYSDRREDEDNDETHTSVRRNTILSWICVAANIVLVAISAYLFVVGVWALFAQHNGGLTAFVGVEGVGLRSPIALGVCLLIASIAGIVNALMLGVGQVAPSVVEGLQVGSRRKAFILHQVMSAITLVLFALVLMSTIPPLSQVTQSGVTSNAWRDMASRYPQKVCNFEIHHQCAGLMDLMCTTNAAGDSTACPGHYCIDGCKVGVRKSMTTINACQACSAVGYSQLLLRCKASEAHKSSSVSCRDPLRKIIRRFFLLIVVSTSIALAWTVIVVLCSILSPLLST